MTVKPYMMMCRKTSTRLHNHLIRIPRKITQSEIICAACLRASRIAQAEHEMRKQRNWRGWMTRCENILAYQASLTPLAD